MIISQIRGGLGNQFFMYAAGKRLAQKHNTLLKLDISGYSYVEPSLEYNKYKLKHFNIIEDIATREEIENIRGRNSRLNKALGKYLPKRMLPAMKVSYVRERKMQFDSDILNLPDGVYLEGYWQSEKYFMDIREILLNELTLKQAPDRINSEFIEKITASNSVAIHVRRGDYLTNPNNINKYAYIDLNYYGYGVDYLSKRINDPYFFVFSDEPEWVKKNILLEFPTIYISHNRDEKDYEDLWLMSLCKHQIIANSTFSW